MKEPIIYKEIKALGTKEYRVVVASLKEDDLPQYAVQHREHGVIEFANENLSFVKDWLEHFTNPDKAKEALEMLPGEFSLPKSKVS